MNRSDNRTAVQKLVNKQNVNFMDGRKLSSALHLAAFKGNFK